MRVRASKGSHQQVPWCLETGDSEEKTHLEEQFSDVRYPPNSLLCLHMNSGPLAGVCPAQGKLR